MPPGDAGERAGDHDGGADPQRGAGQAGRWPDRSEGVVQPDGAEHRHEREGEGQVPPDDGRLHEGEQRQTGQRDQHRRHEERERPALGRDEVAGPPAERGPQTERGQDGTGRETEHEASAGEREESVAHGPQLEGEQVLTLGVLVHEPHQHEGHRQDGGGGHGPAPQLPALPRHEQQRRQLAADDHEGDQVGGREQGREHRPPHELAGGRPAHLADEHQAAQRRQEQDQAVAADLLGEVEHRAVEDEQRACDHRGPQRGHRAAPGPRWPRRRRPRTAPTGSAAR